MSELNAFDAGRLLLPELDRLLYSRYSMLQSIQLNGPIGRRMLAELLHRTERDVRNEVSVLQEKKLINVSQKGMMITNLGYEVLEKLKHYFYDVSGLAMKEKLLSGKLHLSQVTIVPGDVDTNQGVKNFLGREASLYLLAHAKPKSVVAVTGGSSVAAIQRHLVDTSPFNSLKFVAARGGMKGNVRLQANSIAASFAEACGADYHTLYLPDTLSDKAYQLMMDEPVVRETVELYDAVSVVIHGIGTAEEMGKRRRMKGKDYEKLLKSGAVGEAFGYYFNAEGEVVQRMQTVGIQLEQVKKSELILAVAGGKSKAKAIEAYFKIAAPHTILITDEGAADEILSSN